MRKWCYILFLLLLCGAFWGCGKTGITPVSAELKAELEAAWEKEKGYGITWDDEIPDPFYSQFGTHCYGMYEGAVVFADQGQLMGSTQIEVAGEAFYWPSAMTIYVYKSGRFYLLEESYDLGVLTKKNIQNLASVHEAYYNKNYPNRGE